MRTKPALVPLCTIQLLIITLHSVVSNASDDYNCNLCVSAASSRYWLPQLAKCNSFVRLVVVKWPRVRQATTKVHFMSLLFLPGLTLLCSRVNRMVFYYWTTCAVEVYRNRHDDCLATGRSKRQFANAVLLLQNVNCSRVGELNFCKFPYFRSYSVGFYMN